MVARDALEKELPPASLEFLDGLVESIQPSSAQDHVMLEYEDGEDAKARLMLQREQLDLVQVFLCEEVARVRAEWNHLAPINKLPIEVLEHIFLYGAFDDIANYTMLPYSSRTISHVCRYWRGVALSTPLLWSSHRQGHPEEISHRARMIPRDVVVFTSRHMDLNAMYTNMRSLHVALSGSGAANNFTRLTSARAPTLTTLWITSLGKSKDRQPELGNDILFEGLHRVQEMFVRRCSIPWDRFLLRGLRRLSFSEVSILPSTLCNAVQACPSLLDLEIQNCYILPTQAEFIPLLILPDLRKITITILAAEFLRCRFLLMDSVLVPGTADVALRYNTDAQTLDETLFTSLWSKAPISGNALFSPLQICLANCRNLMVNTRMFGLKSRTIHVISRYNDITITFDHFDSKILKSMDELAAFLSLTPQIESLSVRSIGQSRPIPYGPPIARMITALSGLKRVELGRYTVSTEDEIFELLTLQQWMHPIEQITLIKSRSELHQFLRFVQSRISLDEPSSSPTASASLATSPPSKLKLVIRSYFEVHPEVLETLKTLIEVVRDNGP
ncbi:hypothetical protein BOTBODRAFT_185389 [Botryobasidium botryosum FD-172 SS1]|uniref:F-box domain-containing protein n=1 Tax=Botryobasidium botryosum (strain FD-172 SS1) TaxID=930990 RepID=A0A067MTE6_BOTB1|nr:hypothetical protein BOTBODRAFT_185389 [Botryobasidium botryosum FD-172 SS1]